MGLASDSAEEAGRSGTADAGVLEAPEGRCDGPAAPPEGPPGRDGVTDEGTRGCGAVAGPEESSSVSAAGRPGFGPDVPPGWPGFVPEGRVAPED